MGHNYFFQQPSIDPYYSIEFLNKYISKFSEEPVGFLGLEKKFLFRVSRYIQGEDFQLNNLDLNSNKLDFSQRIPILIFTKFKEKVLENYLNKLTRKKRLLERINFTGLDLKNEDELSTLPIHPSSVPQNELFIREGGWLKKILIENIHYIKLEGVYTHLYCHDQSHTLRSTSKEVLAKIPSSDFVQIHKSYFINLHKIDAINCESVKIGNEILPIGRTFHKELIQRINQIGN